MRTYGGEGNDRLTAESGLFTGVWRLEPDDDSPDPPTAEDIREACQYFLGDTAFDASDGRIRRTLPLAHPVFPNAVADGVNVTPVSGEYFTAEETEPGLEATPHPTRVIWDAYEFTASFLPVPYALIRDESIARVDSSYYKDDGTSQSYFYYPEWFRYTDREIIPRADFVRAKQGSLRFRATGAVTDPAVVQVAQMPLPNETIKIIWYRVPYRYVKSANSYLNRFRFRVNQKAWENYGPGELLYAGYTPRRFSPPIVGLDPAWESGVFSTEKLCDITLEFIRTSREAETIPSTTLPPYSDTNRSWVMAGHNLLPHFRDRKFYYASVNNADPTKQFPMFLSFPLELLFVDPDVPNP